MNEAILWSGGREKNSLSMQMFIEIVAKPVEMVLDAYASTCVALSHLNINLCNIFCFFTFIYF